VRSPSLYDGSFRYRICGYAKCKGAIKDSTKSNDDTARKIRVFREEGIKVLDHIGNIGEEMRDLLKEFKQK
jgi:hypothetical protein